jgi:hypothetical protein
MSWYGFDLNSILFLSAWIVVGISAYIYYHNKEEKQKIEARIKRLEDELTKQNDT